MTETFEHAASEIDWSIFGEPVDQTCYCRCDAIYRSHAQMRMDIRRSITKDPCPKCGSHGNCWKISSDPERMTLRG